MRYLNFILLFLFLSFFLVGCQSGKMVPGLYWEQATEIILPKGDTTKYVQNFYLIPEKFRSERLGPYNETFLIVRLDEKIMINVSPVESVYQQVPFEEIIRRQELRKENVRRMRAQMDTLPPSLRWRMERDMGIKWHPEKYQILETDEKSIISGFNCEKFIVTNHDTLEGEYWVTDAFGSLDTYGKDWLGIMGIIISGPQFEKHKLINEKGVIIEAHVGRTKITVTKMEKKLLPESLFDPPEDFEKREVPVWKPRVPPTDTLNDNK